MCKIAGSLAYIDTANKRCSSRCGIEAKGADVGKTIEYTAIFCKPPHSAAVVFLVEKEACFLAIFEIKVESDAVLMNDNART